MIVDLFNCTLQIKLHACWLDQHKMNRSTRILNLKYVKMNERANIIVVEGRGSEIRGMNRMKVCCSNTPSVSFIACYRWLYLVRTSYFQMCCCVCNNKCSTSSRYRTCFAVFVMLMLVGIWYDNIIKLCLTKGQHLLISNSTNTLLASINNSI